jgi:hypothetical protein
MDLRKSSAHETCLLKDEDGEAEICARIYRGGEDLKRFDGKFYCAPIGLNGKMMISGYQQGQWCEIQQGMLGYSATETSVLRSAALWGPKIRVSQEHLLTKATKGHLRFAVGRGRSVGSHLRHPWQPYRPLMQSGGCDGKFETKAMRGMTALSLTMILTVAPWSAEVGDENSLVHSTSARSMFKNYRGCQT